MLNPLVSVIMGVYNSEKSVEKCIESVLQQTYKEWEFIICDDCSTDRTYEVLKKYEKRDQRIKILWNAQNIKLAASLNKCLDAAKGKYIARMDGDDECYPDRFAEQVSFLEDNLEYAVVGSAADITDGEKIVETRQMERIPSKKKILFGPPFMHPTIMMRKTVYDDLDGYTVCERTKRTEDLDLWFRFYEKGYKGYNLQKPLLLYHESKEDYKKRTLETTWNIIITNIYGYKILKFPLYCYPLILKPLISYFLPKKLLIKYRQRMER